MNFQSKKSAKIIFICLIILLVSIFFDLKVMEVIVVIVTIACMAYEKIISPSYTKQKNRDKLSNKLYEFKVKGDYYIVFVSFLGIMYFTNLLSWVKRSGINSVGIERFKEYISIFSFNDIVIFLFLVIIFFIALYSLIYSLRNKTTLYEEGILTWNGILVEYEAIESLAINRFVKTVRYEIKIKGYNGAVYMTCNIEDIHRINKILHNKVNIDVIGFDKNV